MIYNSCSTLIGASLGDSLGSYCEFTAPSDLNSNEIWKGDYNPIFQTAKGQLTDDTEMANSMALGILESLHNLEFDYSKPSYVKTNFIAYYYLFWLGTQPFDIGNTTYKALNIENCDKYFKINVDNDSIISEMSENSKVFNKNSLSNGFLMRHTPMTVLLYYISEMREEKQGENNLKKYIKEKLYDELFLYLRRFISEEIGLTHSNNECIVASALYDFLIINILTNKTEENSQKQKFNFNSEYYLDLLKEFLDKLIASDNQDIVHYREYLQKIKTNFTKINDMNNFQESKTNELLNVGESDIGYYLHAINLIFFIIKYYSDFSQNDESGVYRNIINFICNKGGDTDTNCCIVGAVFGAIVGINNIEKEFLETHLKFNPKNKTNMVQRPFLYAPSILTLYGIKLFSVLNKESNEPKERKDLEGPFPQFSSLSMIDNILSRDLESDADDSFELSKISQLV